MPHDLSAIRTHACSRCVREDQVRREDLPARRLRGLRHRKLHLALDDEQALAQFFTVYPAALTHDTIAYVPQSDGHDPLPVFVSGLSMMKYGMWAEDHAVGTQDEARALVHVGLELSTTLQTFSQVTARFPGLFQTPQELALHMVARAHPEVQFTPAVLRLLAARTYAP